MSQNGGHAAEQDAEVIRPDIGKLTERQGIFPAARLDREAGAAVVLNEPVLISRVAGGVGRGRDVIAAHGGKLPGDRFASRHVVAVILPVDDAALRVVRQGEQRVERAGEAVHRQALGRDERRRANIVARAGGACSPRRI